MTATLIALGALLLLPGLLVVRAPWTVVPSLSLAFWGLSIWWPVLSGLARSRVVAATVLASLLLALLRVVPKHETLPPPGWTPPRSPGRVPERAPRPAAPAPRLASGPALAVLVVALALVGTTPFSRHAPGPGMAFQTTSARLALWRDGIPLSAEPLLPLAPYGAHAPGLATIAADLSALSGSDPARTTLLVFVTAIAALLVGLFTLGATWLRPSAAALVALWGLALAEGLDWLALWGAGEASLCLGFVLPASALALGHVSRSSAFATGMLFAAGLVAQPLLALAVWAACAAVLLSRCSRSGLSRLTLVTGTAVVLGTPGLRPALRALSVRELGSILSPSGRDVAAFLGGLVALLLVALLARRLARHPAPERAVLGAGVAGGALLLALVAARIADAQIPAAREQALLQVAVATGPLDLVCASPPFLDWIPALAGRAAGEPGPRIPDVYQDEWAARVRRRCRASLEGGP